MSHELKIGIDIDGILADFNSAFADLLVKETGKDLLPTPRVYPCWEWPEAVGYDDEAIEECWLKIDQSPSWWQDLAGLPDAMRIIRRLALLRLEGHSIYFITQRALGERIKKQTEEWLVLREYFRPTVLTTEHKGLIARGLDLNAFIDDKPSHALSMPPTTRSYLLKQTYNQQDWERCVGAGVILVDRVEDMFKDLGWGS